MAPGTDGPFVGELAVVTGASRGIGRAIARSLAAAGLDLLLVARSRPDLEAVAAEARRLGRTADVLPLDVGEGTATPTLLAHLDAVGRVPFVLVNNAGIAVARRLERLSREDLDRQLAVNLLGPVRLTHALLPRMLARGRGRFIHIGSGSADFPAPRLVAYSMTKSALRAFSFGLDLEVRRRGVRSSVIEPIFVRTSLGRRPEDAEAPLERLKREHPRFVLEPEVVARAVVGVLQRPRRRVSVPVSWGTVRLLGLAAGPLARRAIELPAPRAEPGDPAWRPLG